ncbi:MAG: DUF6506 family protein [Desulfobacterales bacterium]
MVDEGIEAVELCGGFGNKGTARIVDAVAGKAAVGVVRFDGHPGLGGKSGDEPVWDESRLFGCEMNYILTNTKNGGFHGDSRQVLQHCALFQSS